MTLKRFDLKDQQMTVQASTVLKVLGKSSLFVLDILIRESIQNSLDAVSSNCKDYIRFKFDIVKLNDHNDLINRLKFLEQKKNSDNLFVRLVNRIKENDPVMLILSDSGTTGLSGPVKKNDVNWYNYRGRRNFENLIYQLGINQTASGAGGSYGFGKSIYYHLSNVGLVMFYSKCDEGERLIFSMISVEENKATAQSTGIAWWGNVYRYKGIEYSAPIEKPEKIAEILRGMGIEEKRFKSQETGTVVCVIAPKIKNLLNTEEDLQEFKTKEDRGSIDFEIQRLKIMVENSVLRWYWPRMTKTSEVCPNGKLKQLKFYIFQQEIMLSLEYIAMGELLRAAEELNNRKDVQAPNGIKAEKISHSYGDAFIGTITYRLFDIPLNMRHLNKILMIRAPRMVVYEAPVFERTDKSVAALFLVNSMEKVWSNINKAGEKKSIDDAFRDCESATHSEWNYQDLGSDKSWFKSYVKVAKEKTQRIVQDALNPISSPHSETNISSSAKLLGKLLLSEGGGEVSAYKAIKGNQVTTISPRTKRSTLKITKSDFNANSITVTLEISNIRPGKYYVAVLAKGGKESFDLFGWKQNLGAEFPFQIERCSTSQNISLRIENFAFVKIQSEEDYDLLEVEVTIHFIKRDALLSFRIDVLND